MQIPSKHHKNEGEDKYVILWCLILIRWRSYIKI